MADVTINELSLVSAANLNNNDLLIVEQTSNGTRASQLSSIKEKMLGNSTITGLGGSTATEAIAKLNELVNYSTSNNSTLIHNSIGRGQNITKNGGVSNDQWTEIKNGTFRDMYIGDYWLIGGVTYRIAAFDYYYGKRSVANHHVVIVPDTCLSDPVNMAETATNATGFNGALTYISSAMTTVRNTITSAFGNNHLLSHDLAVSKTIDSNGIVIANETVTTDVTFMTAGNVFGASLNNIVVPLGGVNLLSYEDSIQFPLFRYMPERTAATNSTGNKRYWLRDTYGTDSFVGVYEYGYYASISAHLATPLFRIRPVFCIKGATS